MRVKAVVVRAAGQPPRIEELDLDDPREGEILIRLVASGVARHDLDALAGASPMPLPFVPGTEAAGIVERVGPGVAAPGAGDAVLVGYAACRSCPACAAGDLRHCRRFAELNLSGRRADRSAPFAASGVGGFFFGQSSFATHLVCRAADAVVVESDAALEVLAALPGEFLRGAGPVLRLGQTGGNDAVVIAGAGFVGLTACLTAKALGVGTIIVSEPVEARRRLATEAGATHVVPDDEGLAAVVAAVAPADSVRLVLDASGTASALRACLASAGPDGGCVSVAAGAAEWAVPADAGLDPAELVPRLAALHAAGSLAIERLVNFFPFALVGDAVDAAATGAVVKAVLRFPLDLFGDLDRALGEGAAADDLASPDEPAEAPADAPVAPVAPPVTA